MSPQPQTLRDLLARQAAAHPDAPALGAPGLPFLAHAALAAQADATGRALAARGLGPGSRVALVLPNGPLLASAFVSIASATACAPLNPDYREAEFGFYLEDLKPGALVVAAGMESPARAVARRLGIPVLELVHEPDRGAGAFSFAGGDPGSPGAAPVPPGPGDAALLLHTSGTTSRPKLVPLSQANLCASARHIAYTLRLVPSDRCLNMMPLFHIHGLAAAVLASLGAGASVVCAPGWDADGFFGWLREPGATWYTAVPTLHQSVLGAVRQRGGPPSHGLRLIRSSSSALPVAVMEELERVFGVPVVEAYGMTEAAHQMCSNPLPPAPRKPGSVGLPAGPEVAVMDAEGALLPQGATGEVVIRGPNVTAGYEANPGATAAAFTAGWFRTGDQGYRDADGYVFLTGRLKEMINRGGEKVAPREVDEVLLRHPAVAQAVAFAVPHPRLGEDVAAAVVLRPGMSATEAALREFALAHLAPQKAPSRLVVVDAIPKGPTGKVQRLGLASALASRLASSHEPPSNPVEEAVAAVWQQLLQVDRVGRRDNFFALGGDSLLATRALSRLGEAFGVQVPLGSLFRHPELHEQALLVERLVIEQLEAAGDPADGRPAEGAGGSPVA